MAYGWNVARVGDANNLELVARAFDSFRATEDRPTLIIVDSHIGYGSPHKVDTAAAHGEPLGEEEVKETKRAYGWPEDAQFLVPDEVPQRFADGIGARGGEHRREWGRLKTSYSREHQTLLKQINAMQHRELPEGWDRFIPVFKPDADGKGMATRKASHTVENAIAEAVPWLIVGSADLTDSTSARLTVEDAGDFSPDDRSGRQAPLRHPRACDRPPSPTASSLSKLRPAWSTYLTFSDYARPAIRLSALMELPVIHIFTHDSIGLGEDGPTHQPVEQLASLRAIPGLVVLRPCDANEVAEAWRWTFAQRHQPVALILTRQNVPILDRDRYTDAAALAKGGYVLADDPGGEAPEVILIATGSEVSLAVSAFETLSADGIRARVVSMPSLELFDQQEQGYRDSVLPPDVGARISIEEASTLGWDRYVGPAGATIGMHTFGSSAPLKDVQDKFGFTPEAVVDKARELLAREKEKKA